MRVGKPLSVSRTILKWAQMGGVKKKKKTGKENLIRWLRAKLLATDTDIPSSDPERTWQRGREN